MDENSAPFMKNSVGWKNTTKSYMRFVTHFPFGLFFGVKAATDKNDADDYLFLETYPRWRFLSEAVYSW